MTDPKHNYVMFLKYWGDFITTADLKLVSGAAVVRHRRGTLFLIPPEKLLGWVVKVCLDWDRTDGDSLVSDFRALLANIAYTLSENVQISQVLCFALSHFPCFVSLNLNYFVCFNVFFHSF